MRRETKPPKLLSDVSADIIFLRGCGLQESAYEGLWREDFHRRRVGIAIILQIKEDVRIEENFHDLLQLVLILQVVLYEFVLCGFRAENAAECLMAVLLAFLSGLGLCNELLGVGRELALQQVDAVRTGHVDVDVDGSCFHNSRRLEFHGAKIHNLADI